MSLLIYAKHVANIICQKEMTEQVLKLAESAAAKGAEVEILRFAA